MNKPSHPVTSAGITSASYEDDPHAWALAQADFLRSGQIEKIDWENIAEEIESVGKREYRAAESALCVVLTHILKWRHQPLYRSRSWANSIKEHVRRFDRELRDNPSLKAHLDDLRRDAYEAARSQASQETGLLPESFPATAPDWSEIRAEFEL